MDMVKNVTPARATLSAEGKFDLVGEEGMKILTPGDPPVERFNVVPPAGKRWKLVVTISGEEVDA